LFHFPFAADRREACFTRANPNPAKQVSQNRYSFRIAVQQITLHMPCKLDESFETNNFQEKIFMTGTLLKKK